MPDRRRPYLTALEIPSDHGVQRSTTTQVGYESLVEPAASLEPLPSPAPRPAPWTEDVYVSPSGRIFLPAGFDFDDERPRALTRCSVRREPPPPRPTPRRAHVVIGQVLPRPRAITRESWVVPQHLRPS